MKLIANVPVTKITKVRSYTFEMELQEISVYRITRVAADRYRKRYHYMIHGVPAAIHPEAVCSGIDGTYETLLVRKLNPKWKPPIEGWIGDTWIPDVGTGAV